jgi:hypothetical protein
MRVEPCRLFIGSSVESLDIAYALQECLEYDCEPTVWNQGIFEPSATALASLVKRLDSSDFAVFVFGPDDVVTLRGKAINAARDNVVFEFGLFVGRLGVERCLIVTPRLETPLHFPTDLIGLTTLSFNPDRSDGRVIAALGPAANQLRRQMRRLGRVVTALPSANRAPTVEAPDFAAEWNGAVLAASRKEIRELALDHYSDAASEQRGHLWRVFVFLESMADAVLSGHADEEKLQTVFKTAVLSFWPTASIMLAPPNHKDDFWVPPPKLAELYARWKQP